MSTDEQRKKADAQAPKQGRGSMRNEMPVVAAWIDEMRNTFGVELIDSAIKSGLAGEPTFFASENGKTLGTKLPENFPGSPRVGATKGWCAGCTGECVGTKRECRGRND